eukprot:TRINITY_DN66845_c3_g3_i1.p1 TRINITY_DN66845_c3_g3~~TRINITY_DN66845_c3_g3_i1.p1  ORF type:complete len:142 (+),score=14.77 TRINITY_DN66845_c3_g3_i1:13-438(+)
MNITHLNQFGCPNVLLQPMWINVRILIHITPYNFKKVTVHLGVLFKDELKLPLRVTDGFLSWSAVAPCTTLQESVPGDFNEYKEGMAKAGYNLSTLVVLPEGWNCDEATARGKIRRCDFLMIVCEETHAFVYNDEAAAGLF